jgi:hypothetical protein
VEVGGRSRLLPNIFSQRDDWYKLLSPLKKRSE